MKWLTELGSVNLACAGLPCGWPEKAEPDVAAEPTQPAAIDEASQALDAGDEPETVLH